MGIVSYDGGWYDTNTWIGGCDDDYVVPEDVVADVFVSDSSLPCCSNVSDDLILSDEDMGVVDEREDDSDSGLVLVANSDSFLV
jgi:hypothetical protein